MNIKSKAGFTLVELIVVIAILGILAGIAVPAYSGYIKKANEAADSQIVSAANTAFAAAMTENGKDPKDVDTYLVLTSNATTKTVAVTAETGDAVKDLASAIVADFTTYYGGTEIKFEYYTGATFNTDGTLNPTQPS